MEEQYDTLKAEKKRSQASVEADAALQQQVIFSLCTVERVFYSYFLSFLPQVRELKRDLAAAEKEKDTLNKEKTALLEQKLTLTSERDSLREQKEAMEGERDTAVKELEGLKERGEEDRLKYQVDSLRRQLEEADDRQVS